MHNHENQKLLLLMLQQANEVFEHSNFQFIVHSKYQCFFRLQLICPFLVVPHAYPASLKYALYAHIYTGIEIFN